LKLEYHKLLSTVAFNFNLRLYTVAETQAAVEEARGRLDSEDRPAKPGAVARAARTVGPRVKTTRGLVKVWLRQMMHAMLCHIAPRRVMPRHRQRAPSCHSIDRVLPRHATSSSE